MAHDSSSAMITWWHENNQLSILTSGSPIRSLITWESSLGYYCDMAIFLRIQNFLRNLVKRWGADGVQSLQLTSLSNIFCFSQNWDQPIFYCSSLFSTSIYHWFLNLLNIKIWNPCFNWILELNLIEFNTKDFKYVLKLGWNTFEFGAKRSRNNVLSG